MDFFIIFLLPSVFGIKLFMNFNKEKKIFDLFIYYFLFVLFSNLIVLTLLIMFNNVEYNLMNYASTNFVFCVKYMCMSLVANLILSILLSVFSKYFIFNVEVEREKKHKRNFKSN